MLIKKLMNTDLDSTDDIGEKSKKIREIKMEEENSIASSITMDSENTKSTTASYLKSDFSINSEQTATASNTSIRVNGKRFTLGAIGVTEDMSDGEVKRRLEAHFSHQRNKEDLKKEEIFQNFINERKKLKGNEDSEMQ